MVQASGGESMVVIVEPKGERYWQDCKFMVCDYDVVLGKWNVISNGHDIDTTSILAVNDSVGDGVNCQRLFANRQWVHS